MIWLLLGFLLFGTGGDRPALEIVEATRSRVEEVVPDAARRARVDRMAGGFADRLELATERFQAQEERFLEALRRKDSSRDELDAHLSVTRGIRRGIQIRMLDLRDQLRSELSREEWEQVFPLGVGY